MISRASAKFVRISPRKTRLVADTIRGKAIDEAQAVLMHLDKRATIFVQEVLNSAVANTKNNPDISASDLYISKITVDGGPVFKRYRAGSMGRAMMIKHRTSHILIELDLTKKAMKEMEAKAQQEVKAKKPKAKAVRQGTGAKLKKKDSKVNKLTTGKRGK
ncbi:MAG: 50S ribosomal protein L22 [Candidatus Omnitrophica bacterium]|nr:50S ribosomal protein L22 [Candidatus Omnitrophota bacterium]